MPFASLDELQGFIRRSRPSMDWEAAALSAQPLHGSVVAFGGERLHMTSTQTTGGYEIEGVVSISNIVLAMAIDIGAASSIWRTDIGNGGFAMVQPRQSVDAVFRVNPGYLTVDISRDMLEAELALHDLCPPPRFLDSNVVLDGAADAMHMAQIRHGVARMHLGQKPALPPGYSMEQLVRSWVIAQFSRHCEIHEAQTGRSYARIVGRARDFIDAHISHPISLDELCKASYVSKRTLHRAFLEVMGDTPQQFILKLRLDRIRRDLAYSEEEERTVTVVSMRWGITELGRLAARYREQFGELPSETLRRRRGIPTVGAAPPRDRAANAARSALRGCLAPANGRQVAGKETSERTGCKHAGHGLDPRRSLPHGVRRALP